MSPVRRPLAPPPKRWAPWPVTWLEAGGWRFFAAWPILAVLFWIGVGLLSCAYGTIVLGEWPPCAWLVAELREPG